MAKRRSTVTPDELTSTGASLLGFLHEGPLSGWDLVAKAEATIGDFWNITKSQVYRELETLTAAGLVTQGKMGARARQPYTLTSRGRSAFQRWLSQEPGPLLMRWPLALTVFFGRQLGWAKLRPALVSHRQRHKTIAATLRKLEPTVRAGDDPYTEAVLRLGIRFHSLVVDWIDSLPDDAKS